MVDLGGSQVLERAVQTFFDVVVEKDVEPVAQLVAAVGRVETDVVVFDRAPQALDEHVVDGSSHAVHRDPDAGVE